MDPTHLLVILLSPRLLFALAVHGLLIVGLEYVTARVNHAVREVPLSAWIAGRVLLPWARVVVLLVFVALAYPRLFGLQNAPPLADLLWVHDGRISTLLNIVFLLSLLLPLTPMLGNLKGLVLPLQAITMATLLFHWLTLALGRDAVSYWPGWLELVAILLLAPCSQWLALRTAGWLGPRLDRLQNRTGFEALGYEGLLLFFQVPAVLIYTLALGRQLAS